MLPAVLFLAGTSTMATFATLQSLLPGRWVSAEVIGLLFLALLVVTVTGLLLGTTTLASLLGRLVAERTRRPALLLAARRMVSAPSHTSRANATLLLVVLLAAFAQGLRENFLTSTADYGTDFYADTFDLVNVALLFGAVIAAAGLLVGTVDGVVSRRRVLAGLHAVGVSRATIARAVLFENLVPLTPAVVLASLAGLLAARGSYGRTVGVSVQGGDGNWTQVAVAVPIPWESLGVLVVVVLAAAALATAASYPVLKVSLRPAELRAD